jgi:two-component sensor histidine kinase
LGLLINEVLTNSYKHAFPNNKSGIVSVNLVDHDIYCLLTIADDGVGLPSNIDVSETPSMGMELIYILAEQLDANLKIENKNGTQFILELKKLN